MKKAVSILISVVLIMSLSMTAFAKKSPGHGGSGGGGGGGAIHFDDKGTADPYGRQGPGDVIIPTMPGEVQIDPSSGQPVTDPNTGMPVTLPGEQIFDIETKTEDVQVNVEKQVDDVTKDIAVDITYDDLKQPSGDGTEIIGGTTVALQDKDGNTAFLVVTPYDEMSTIISAESRALTARAHSSLLSTDAVQKFETEVADVLGDRKLATKEVIADTVFDITYYVQNAGGMAQKSENYGTVTISLPSEVLSSFVALAQYVNGSWKIVDSAKILDGNKLQFSADFLSQYCLILDNTFSSIGYSYLGAQSPKTGYQEFPWSILALMLTSLGGAAFCLRKGYRKNDSEN